MSDRQLAIELQDRNILAERIVLRQRQKIGAERRAHEREYQRRNNDRALGGWFADRSIFATAFCTAK